MKKLEVECLSNSGKEKDKKENSLVLFAEAYVQVKEILLRYVCCPE
jgi:hypothetical protein